jgi:hypothetical protein
MGLGAFRENIESMRRAIMYLKQHRPAIDATTQLINEITVDDFAYPSAGAWAAATASLGMTPAGSSLRAAA